MNLTFNILWFDDNIDDIDSFEDSLTDYLFDLGFKLIVNKESNISDKFLNTLSESLQTYNPYDLVIFDYDFGKGDAENGVTAAQKIRKAIYTDIIFYSSSRELLRENLKNEYIQGSYVVNKLEFDDDIEPILNDHIKKFTSINNIRGLILSEMSEIEIKLRKKFSTYHTNTKDTFTECSLSEIKTKKINQTLDSIRDTKDEELIIDPYMYSFEDIRINYKRFIEHAKGDSKVLINNALLHKYQQKRNKFAHRLAEYSEELKAIMLLDPKSMQDEQFTFDDFTKIRMELIELKEQVDSLPEN